ncbi:hypothetical protein [Chryseobacterium sp.]|uniref:hypothetical protein n=1 Tax=Chryseobacterium sp. TaxID=1871047 RepID=UPI00321A024E
MEHNFLHRKLLRSSKFASKVRKETGLKLLIDAGLENPILNRGRITKNIKEGEILSEETSTDKGRQNKRREFGLENRGGVDSSHIQTFISFYSTECLEDLVPSDSDF